VSDFITIQWLYCDNTPAIFDDEVVIFWWYCA